MGATTGAAYCVRCHRHCSIVVTFAVLLVTLLVLAITYATGSISSSNTICPGYAAIPKSSNEKIDRLDFVNASIEFPQFRDGSFDGIAILEVLEHLPGSIQEYGLQESLRLLKKNGLLIVSIPYDENIIKTKCIHCGKVTPLYGHLHRLDENYIREKIGNDSNFVLRTSYLLPNVQMISCKPFFRPLPFRLWLLLNDLLGIVKKGYWAVYCLKNE